MKYFLILLFLFTITVSKSQTIKGKVSDESGSPISSVTVLLKDNDHILSFTSTKKDGFFEVDLLKDAKYIEIKKLGFENNIFHLDTLNIEKDLDFKLYKSNLLLKEVLVTNKKGFVTKNDTVYYNVDHYKSGMDKSIEDVLKKLPGVTVEENGIIKYRNKPIEKLLLDGDDLFGDQYTNGSKNISPDMIEQVQALNNFEENGLLKNIKYSDNVALNLKLKKGVAELSGNGEIGYGVANRYEAKVNGLLVSNFLKNFSTFSYNNTGINTTPFDYFSGNADASSFKIKDQLAKTAINDPFFYSSVGKERSNRNSYVYGNSNTILKLSKSSSLRINFTYLNDLIKFNTERNSNYFIENVPDLNLSEQSDLRKKPELYDLNLKFTSKNKDKSSFENEFVFRSENTLSETFIQSNYRNNFKTALNTKNTFIKNYGLWTEKLNNKQTIQFYNLFSYNNKPQEYVINPGIDLSRNNELIMNTSQISNYKKYYNSLGFNLFGRVKKGKYELNANQSYIVNRLDSEILQDDKKLNGDFENKLNYQILTGNIEGKYSFLFRNFVWANRLKIKNYWLKNLDDNANHTVFNPEVNLTYNFNSENKANLNISYDEIAPQEQNMYSNYILTDFRTLTSNIPSFNFQKTKSVGLNFSKIDGYHQLTWISNVNYQSNINNLFNTIEIEDNLTKIKSYVLNERNESLGILTSLEKYYYPIRSNLRLKLAYNWMNYKNIVNDSGLRTNINETYNINFFYKSLFNFFINIENDLNFNYNQISTKNIERSVHNSSWNNSFKLLVKPSKNMFVNVTWDYFKLNSKSNLSYNFLDFLVKYKVFKNKYEISLKGQNLLNNNKIETISISDYSESRSSYSLNQRFVLLGINFQF